MYENTLNLTHKERDINIKTIMGFFFLPFTLAKIKKFNNRHH